MVADFVDSALAAIPPGILARVARPRVDLIGEFADEETTSEWKEFAGEVKITVATASLDPHDVGMEVLVCLGQALWEHLTDSERKRYLRLLSEELDAGVTGEIDENALEEKRRLLSSRILAQSTRRLLRYAQASFGATVAEFVHFRWHAVSLREGPEHLPAEWLKRRFELLEKWFCSES